MNCKTLFAYPKTRVVGTPNNLQLSAFDNRFRLIQRRHLTLLLSWSLLNGCSGLVAMFTSRGSAYYFWMMNGTWGCINTVVAIVLSYHVSNSKTLTGNSFDCKEIQKHVERMLLINSGLDMCFILIGFWLLVYGCYMGTKYHDLWLGFGCAIVMQGLFLLVQDIIILQLHRRNHQLAATFLETIEEIPTKKTVLKSAI